MIDLGTLKLLGYAAVIGYLNVTGGGTYEGVSIKPCTEMLCPRPPPPPIGSMEDGEYRVRYSARSFHAASADVCG